MLSFRTFKKNIQHVATKAIPDRHFVDCIDRFVLRYGRKTFPCATRQHAGSSCDRSTHGPFRRYRIPASTLAGSSYCAES
jgi:hypothetical protein